MSYEIRLASEVANYLQALTARQRSIALEGIRRYLIDQPLEESRNRKRMRPESLAAWELRLGDLRTYYEVEDQTETVWILAIGVKLRERVKIGHEVIDP